MATLKTTTQNNLTIIEITHHELNRTLTAALDDNKTTQLIQYILKTRPNIKQHILHQHNTPTALAQCGYIHHPPGCQCENPQPQITG